MERSKLIFSWAIARYHSMLSSIDKQDANRTRQILFSSIVLISVLYVFASQGDEAFWRWLISAVFGVFGLPFRWLLGGLLGGVDEELTAQVLEVSSTNIAFILIYYAVLRYILVDKADNKAQHTWADSVYYLGFILTLTSLIVALTQIKGSEGQEVMKGIIVQNAIALSSTVVALICRTSWKQSIFEPDDELDYVERLNRAYAELERRLDAFGITFDESSRSIKSRANELSFEISRTSEKFRELDLKPDVVAKAFIEVVEKSLDGLSPAFTKLRGGLQSATREIEGAVRKFIENTSAVDAGTILENNISAAIGRVGGLFQSQFQETLGQILRSTESYSEQMNEGASSLGQAVDDLRLSVVGLDIGSTLTDELRTSLSGVPEVVDSGLRETLARIQAGVAESVAELQNKSIAMTESAREFSERISNFDPGAAFQDQTKEVIDQYISKVKSDLLTSQELFSNLSKLQADLTSAFGRTASEIGGTSEQLGQISISAKQTNDSFSAAGSALQDAIRQVGELERLFENSQELRSEMAELRAAIGDLIVAVKDNRSSGWLAGWLGK